MSDRWIVVTTINPPTEAIRRISSLCRQGWSAVVVGDLRSPPDWEAKGIDYLSSDRQRAEFPGLAQQVPWRHYGRKNLGYLYAIARGARVILETDDDNLPYTEFGQDCERRIRGQLLRGPGWVNVYKRYTDVPCWPRGLPLTEIQAEGTLAVEEREFDCPVQQYLADGDPDVDAIHRLVTPSLIHFRRRSAAVVPEQGAWTPFNSQNTLFFADAFPLLYLPCFVSFRMTDIWRSFVAQRALWAHGLRLAFRDATVEQQRNAHDLMRDFRDEVPGYLDNARIATALDDERPDPSRGMAETARVLWRRLAAEKIVLPQELELFEAWLAAIRGTVDLEKERELDEPTMHGFVEMEAPPGFEPGNEGFAVPCLTNLATVPPKGPSE